MAKFFYWPTQCQGQSADKLFIAKKRTDVQTLEDLILKGITDAVKPDFAGETFWSLEYLIKDSIKLL